MHNAGRYVFFTLLLPIGSIESKADGSQTTAAVSTLRGFLGSIQTCPFQTLNCFTNTLSGQCPRSVSTTPTAGPTTDRSTSTTDSSISSATPIKAATTEAPASVKNARGATRSSCTAEALPNTSRFTTVHASSTESWTSTTSTSRPSVIIDEGDGSPLDTAHFLSFEDWRKQKLARAGQSADNVGQGRVPSGASETRHRPGGMNNAIDALGEDAEIELNFDGFGAASITGEAVSNSKQSRDASQTLDTFPSDVMTASESGQAHPRVRRKEAGKTSKERFNYASFDCAANVLKTNPKCKSSSSILVENKDSYMLNVCSEPNKFLIAELCNDILIDTVVLANFEFFSSMFRTFRVSVSDRYPVKLDRWKELGVFEARNTRELQAFAIENPLIWARYLRVEFLTHYGNEYYCPLSLLRVHGTTMMEEYRHEEDTTRGEEEVDDEDDAVENEAHRTTQAGTVGIGVVQEAQESSAEPVVPAPDPVATSLETSTTVIINAKQHAAHPSTSRANVDDAAPQILQNSNDGICLLSENETNVFISLNASPSVCPVGEIMPKLCRPSSMPTATSQSHSNSCSESIGPSASSAGSESSERSVASFIGGSVTAVVPSSVSNSAVTSLALSNRHSPPEQASACAPDNLTVERSSVKETSNKDSLSASQTTGSKTSTSVPPARTSPERPLSSSSLTSSKNAIRPASSATQPSTPSPTTQESFFKSIHKRLSLLEANASLSLQYIESQSLLLRNAFSAVSKQQSSKTDRFLESLNTTVSTELREFRMAYNQLWQSTLVELDQQRKRWEKEVDMVGRRVGEVVEEVVWLERVVVVQGLLVVICLGLLIFSKMEGLSIGGSEGYQSEKNMRQKTPDSFSSLSQSPPDSPGRSTRPSSAATPGKIFWLRSSSPATTVHTDHDSCASKRSRSPDSALPTPEGVSDAETQDSRQTSAQQRTTYLTPSPSQTSEMLHEGIAASAEARSSSSPPTPTGLRTSLRGMEVNAAHGDFGSSLP